MTARSTIVLATIALASIVSACATGSDAVEVPGGPAASSSVSAPMTAPEVSTTSSTSTTIPATTTSSPPPTTAAPSTTAPPVTTAERTITLLRQGDEGPEVALIQRKLITLGYLPAGSDTGVFGGATNSAVLGFQSEYGLVVDGLVGPETERSISAAANSISSG